MRCVLGSCHALACAKLTRLFTQLLCLQTCSLVELLRLQVLTCAELLMAAFAYSLYQILGIFIPLIVTNCAILGRADAFASRQPVLPAALDGFMMGLGFGWVLVLLGAIRELLGQGTLFHNMHLLLGPRAAEWQITVMDDYQFLFFMLPPGAFFVAGCRPTSAACR